MEAAKRGKRPKGKLYAFELSDARKARHLGISLPHFQARMSKLNRQVKEAKRSGKPAA